MPYSYVHFQYYYVNSAGFSTGFVPKYGKVDEDGISLEEETLPYRDLQAVSSHKKRLAIQLLPTAEAPEEIAKHIVKDTYAVVVEVEGDAIIEAKKLLVQYLTTYQCYQRKTELEREGKGDDFRAEQCPNCLALLDLSYYTPTNYIYCKHCETIFDKLRQPLPHSENYRVCPDCDYYGRVQEHREFSCYALPKDRRLTYTKHEFCDTCAERLIEQIWWKNALYLVGIPTTLFMYLTIKESPSPLYAEMTQANRYAQDGKLQQALDLYMLMTLRNEKHPAIWLNYGLAYLAADDTEKALRYLKKSLECCSNYQPVLDVLAKYSDKEVPL
jgi:tetratricopeptide (TPR) repeat protein